MKNKIIITVLVILMSGLNLFSQDINESNIEKSVKKEFRKLDLKEKLTGVDLKVQDKIDYNDIMKKQEKKEKSPILGGALSAVLPGAGQFYGENLLKSAIFLGVEAGLWVTYAIFQNKGNEQTDFYEKYADENWDVRKYATWLKTEGFPGSGSIDPSLQNIEVLRLQVNACEDSSGFSHKLPPFGDQQYYEVIGKYRNYIPGWSQVFGITKNNYQTIPVPEQINYYMNEREQANTYYNNGSLTLTVVIVNHILSAADAVWTVSMFNKSLEVKTSVEMKYIYSLSNFQYNLTPFANLNLSF